MDVPDHLTVKEFSRRSGCSVATVWRRIKDGSLRHKQLGGPRHRVFIPRDALEPSQPTPPTDDPLATEVNTQTSEMPLPGPKPGWRKSVDLT